MYKSNSLNTYLLSNIGICIFTLHNIFASKHNYKTKYSCMNRTKKIKKNKHKKPCCISYASETKGYEAGFSPMFFDEYILHVLCIDKTCKALKINTDWKQYYKHTCPVKNNIWNWSQPIICPQQLLKKSPTKKPKFTIFFFFNTIDFKIK